MAWKNPAISQQFAMLPDRQSESILDVVNDLKVENATLKRALIAVGMRDDEVDDVLEWSLPESQHTNAHRIEKEIQPVSRLSECKACRLLENQVDRLSDELDRLRGIQSEANVSLETKVRHLVDALSRENQRRLRMESIIQRQQSHIKELTAKLKDLTGLGDESEQVSFPWSITRPQVDDFLDSHRPWELDMDDLNRQLEELDTKVHKVEESKNRLASSTQVAFGVSMTEAERGPSNATTLDRMLNEY
jgi:DNA repair exonuclease SbcCD ATPase subunit